MVKAQTTVLAQFFLRLFIRKGSVLTKLKLVCPEWNTQDWQQTCKYAALMNSTDILKYLGTIKKLKVGDLAYNIKQSRLLGELAITCNNLKRLDVSFYRTTTRKKHIPGDDLASLILSQNSLSHFRYRGISEKLATYSLTTQTSCLKYIEFDKTNFKGDSTVFYWIAQCEVLECLVFKLCRYIEKDMLVPMFKNDALIKLNEVQLSIGMRSSYECEGLEEWIRWRKFNEWEHHNLYDNGLNWTYTVYKACARPMFRIKPVNF
ncbi:3630_t:CDS:2 [Acaulospora colombiana]|uniref:3630_t:CDS:1 n=1 Tax=Acaulospora colombiana TaxID=27376 RepID=A0ACA9KZU9_9GLOM|nr:3630_t:CDS:2 [Acaulospora colombiana]